MPLEILIMTEQAEPSFNDFDVDDRILKAVSKLQWTNPTPVQRKAIPLALEGKDLIVRAQTGSGKTAAYLIPVIEKLLKQKVAGDVDDGSLSLILVPSKELCKQAYRNCIDLVAYCSKTLSVIDIGNSNVNSVANLVSSANILISTPSKILAHINNKTVDLQKDLKFLVIDEADIMFSYGYEQDLKSLVNHLPKIYQALLVSATMSKDVDNLKGLVLHNPIVLKLEESDIPDDEKLKQYVIRCEASDKYLLAYALFKLNLVRGKTLIFVNSIDKCYRLKLFYEQFYIRTCILNSELPQSVRVHIVDEFNRGVYDVVIATDESISIDTNVSLPRKVKGKKKGKGKKDDKEYSVARGIDFQDVDNVLNFDFPTAAENYIHRIGRTARGYNSGTALSFVASEEDSGYLKKVEAKLKSEGGANCALTPYNFKVDEIEGLRYRVSDAFGKVTKIKVREARLKEIKGEIYNSTKLKTYFEENPKELRILKHDKVLAPTEQQPHMKNIPEYLVPDALKHIMLKPKRKRKFNVSMYDKNKKKKANNPLKTFKVSKK